ncbi:MAG: hypothetical protein J6B26_07915 [Agathobacter sp.]|nr:hypothetical protein [Agathobacter sp.]
MINEERVKELYQIAKYDTFEEKENRQMGHYYHNDYISKELLKSFFSGSVGYVLLVALWFMNSMEYIMNEMSTPDLIATATTVVLIYVAFMAIYLMITWFVYEHKYTKGRKALKEYYDHVRKINKMYDREEKLKV